VKHAPRMETLFINRRVVRKDNSDILNSIIHMRSVQVSKANGPLEIVERDIPEPGGIIPRHPVSKGSRS
jgi:hypothetical protein